MNLLGIDTSSENISLCFMREGSIVIDYNHRMQFGSTKLIEYINKNLKKLSLNLSDFDAFIIGSGPGSFTGLRISFSIIKAFSIATGKPAVAICSFFSCAYALRRFDRNITVISDARKDLVYAASFKPKNNCIVKDGKERLLRLKEAVKENRDGLFVTYDSHLRKQALDYNAAIDFYSQDIYPKARDLLLFAKKSYNSVKFSPVDKLEPLYLHPKTCQIKRKN